MLTERMLIEATELVKVEAFPNGTLIAHWLTIITRDGVEVTRVPNEQRIEAGSKLPENWVVKAVAGGLWNATDLTKATVVPGSRRGRLYRSRGASQVTSPTPAPSAPPTPIPVDDKRAVTIRHRGAEQR